MRKQRELRLQQIWWWHRQGWKKLHKSSTCSKVIFKRTQYSVIQSFLFGGNHDSGYRVGYVSIITSTHPHTFNNFNSSEPEALDSLRLCLVGFEGFSRFQLAFCRSTMGLKYGYSYHTYPTLSFIAFDNRTIYTCIYIYDYIIYIYIYEISGLCPIKKLTNFSHFWCQPCHRHCSAIQGWSPDDLTRVSSHEFKWC